MPFPGVERLEQWRHPVTGERIILTFGEGVTRLERGGWVENLTGPPFDEAAALREAQEQVGRWDPFSLRHLRDMAGAGAFRDQGVFGVEDLGFPAPLWEELAAFEARMALGSSSCSPPGAGSVPAEYHSATLTQTDDSAQGGLLWNPTPGMRRRFAELMAQRVGVSPPPADMPFHQRGQDLRREGFVRMTARNGDGSLWLPPVLEPYRPQLQASERPVVRLAAEPGRKPRARESKVGGVPYRPKGTGWPLAPDGRPLVFLTQINLGEVNGDGQALPDFPSRGLLQFFILNDDFYGADMGSSMNLGGDQKHYRALYWPEVVEDEAALDPSVPRPEYDPAEVERLREGGFDLLVEDGYLIGDRLPHDPAREVALTFLPDREPVSGADDSSGPLLGLNLHAWEDEGAQAVRSALYDLAPGGHKLGGSPDFTQSDPRRPEDDLILLFQLDSDERLGLMWGDVGTANFFIRPADLGSRDFSRVAYHWDCG